MPSLYETTPETGTVSSANSTSLYSNTSDFTTGLVNSSVYSVTGGTGVTVNPTTGNVVVSIGQPVATTDNVTFATVTTTGDIAVNGGDITTTQTTASLFDTTATTLNIGGAATTINLGASTGVVNIDNSSGLSLNSTNASIFVATRLRMGTARLVTSATTANQVLFSLTAATYHNIKAQVSIVSGSDYHSADITITHDGTTSYITVANEMWTNISLTDWNTDISGSFVRLLVTPTNAVTTYTAANNAVI